MYSLTHHHVQVANKKSAESKGKKCPGFSSLLSVPARAPPSPNPSQEEAAPAAFTCITVFFVLSRLTCKYTTQPPFFPYSLIRGNLGESHTEPREPASRAHTPRPHATRPARPSRTLASHGWPRNLFPFKAARGVCVFGGGAASMPTRGPGRRAVRAAGAAGSRGAAPEAARARLSGIDLAAAPRASLAPSPAAPHYQLANPILRGPAADRAEVQNGGWELTFAPAFCPQLLAPVTAPRRPRGAG